MWLAASSSRLTILLILVYMLWMRLNCTSDYKRVRVTLLRHSLVTLLSIIVAMLICWSACGTTKRSWAFLYSSKYSLARLLSRRGSFICLPCTTWFIWFQVHAWTRKNLSSAADNLSNKNSNSCIKTSWSVEHFCKAVEQPAHTSGAATQPHITCNAVSGARLQQWQMLRHDVKEQPSLN